MHQRVSAALDTYTLGKTQGHAGLRHRSYRTTLNQRDTVDDADEREHVLKACHKRCALRTLKVLETNGGIFIKLGQHLVRPLLFPG